MSFFILLYLLLCGCIIRVMVDPKNCVYISRQQLHNGKMITYIQNLRPEIDKVRLLRGFKTEFHCSGTIKDDDISGEGDLIQLSGDQRNNMVDFLFFLNLYDESEMMFDQVFDPHI